MSYFPELLKYVQLPQLQSRYLLDVVRNHTYIQVISDSIFLISFDIQSSRECRDIVCDALIELIKNGSEHAVLPGLARKEESCYQYAAGQVECEQLLSIFRSEC